MTKEELVRLNKLMSTLGLCSRREADDLIAKGLVRVDGNIVSELGLKVSPRARIEILAKGAKQLAEKVTILLNKPKGYVSSQPEDGYSAAVELIRPENYAGSAPLHFQKKILMGLAPAGRLDIDSQGLLILTQDGSIAKKLIGENSEIEKEYIVRVTGDQKKIDLKVLCNGQIVIEGRQLKPAQVEWINEDQLRFVLKEGMKRQVRKMCEYVGLKVTGLKRVRIGRIRLGSLPEGKWRFLEDGELF